VLVFPCCIAAAPADEASLSATPKGGWDVAERPSEAARPKGAIFLSYASEDAVAAERISDALRAAGIEVWFDRAELRGGDAWDEKIRREIRDCALFMPIVSANTAARHEGYFRLEWDLADQRSHMIARSRAFIVPVVVDDTSESAADTPDSFLRVQWTRLPGGATPPAFVERVRQLLLPPGSQAVAPTFVAPSSKAAVPRVRRRSILHPKILVPAVAAAVAVTLGYFAIERTKGSGPRAQGVASIAVLPLANESGDASQQYFSDGISEDLITALSRYPELKVIGRTSAFQFRDTKEDSRTIGAKLGVAHLVEGSVRRSGDVVRVSAELIDTTDGSTQWSERYDRPYNDLFALQDYISGAVAGALKAKLIPAEHVAAQSERPPSGSLGAYNALLQGRFYSSRETEADYRQAIESFTQATTLDPSYALAWSALSQAWTSLGASYLILAPAAEAFANARVAADTAIALAPGLASAHVARGELLYDADFDWHGAEAEFRRALELAPRDADARAGLGEVLTTLGQLESAADIIREAIVTDPLRSYYYWELAYCFWGLNRLDEAETTIRRAIELQPSASLYRFALTRIEVQRGDFQAALAAADREPPGKYQDAALALARQIGNDRSAADAALKILVDRHAEFFPYTVAEVYAIRNEADRTFEWLDKAWRYRDEGFTRVLYDPFILRYKDDPRFAAFCHKVGLPVPGEDRQRT
jgi:TolB-like protein/Tfp pilus assembly protein PilF